MDYTPHPVRWTTEKIKRFWDFYINYPHFDHLWFTRTAGRGILGLARKHTPVEGRVLDYGVGKGYFTGYLLENSRIQAVACDFSEEIVNTINARFKVKAGFNGCVLVKGMPTPFSNGEFQSVFLIEAIEHLTDEYLEPTLKEIHRILKPGGMFIVTTPNEEELEQHHVLCPDCGAIYHPMQHVRHFSASSLEHQVKAMGFQTVFCGATDFLEYGERGWLYTLKNRITQKLKRSYRAPHLAYIGKKAP